MLPTFSKEAMLIGIGKIRVGASEWNLLADCKKRKERKQLGLFSSSRSIWLVPLGMMGSIFLPVRRATWVRRCWAGSWNTALCCHGCISSNTVKSRPSGTRSRNGCWNGCHTGIGLRCRASGWSQTCGWLPCRRAKCLYVFLTPTYPQINRVTNRNLLSI